MTVYNEEEVQYCKWHSKTETTLACYQCGTPICIRCARRTPVGYICPDCLRGRKQRFEQARPTDYIIVASIALVLGFIANILPLVGWYVIFLSPLAGIGIAEVVWRAVGRRYSSHLWWVVGASLVVSSAPVFLLSLLSSIGSISAGNTWGVVGLIWVALHVALIVGAAVGRLRMQ
ncbi:MAG TPA: hypothetical protein PKH77_04185 [Anaerolineae bacterium]|nr:hypothetical protein [Anaerolineae bacterium]